MPAAVLSALRDHLIAADVVRDPAVAGASPPMWLEPRYGVRAPGEGTGTEIGADAVIAAFVSGGIPPRPYESWQRRPIIDLRFRTSSSPRAHELDAAIRAALIDRRNWLMGTLRIIESQVWREFQPLGADAQAFDFVTAWIFQIYDQP